MIAFTGRSQSFRLTRTGVTLSVMTVGVSSAEIKKFLAEYNRLKKEMEAAYVRHGVNEFARILNKKSQTLVTWRNRGWNLKPETLAACLETLVVHEKKSGSGP